jgi:heavy metal translocating P-type ATPase
VSLSTAEPPGPKGGRPVPSVVRRYPIPFFAIAGLALGLLLWLVARQPETAGDVWLATLIVGGIPLVVATARRVYHRQFQADIIAALAIVAAIALDQPFAGVVIVLMQSSGEALERYAFHRASSSLERLLSRAPRRAHRLEDGRTVEIPVEEVRPGDRLAIRSGDLLPVDGRIVDGTTSIDESAVTGEPLPRTCGPGDEVLSGSVNVDGSVVLEALRSSPESQYSKIVDLVTRAQAQKPAFQRLADRYATWFTPLAVALAVVAALYTRSPVNGLAVLVVATPCPLILAVPIAIVGALDRASGRGLLIKSGAALEELGRAEAILFDKTGTLTSGRPDVERIVAFAGFRETDLVRWSAALEQYSSHPIASALVRAAAERGGSLPAATERVEFPGAGVQGNVEGRRVVVGSALLSEREVGRPLDVEWTQVRAAGALAGRMVSFLVVDRAPAGAVVFSDRLRPEVPGLVQRLRGLGLRHVGMITGDRRENAAEVARAAGLDAFASDLKPEEKVSRVGEARRRYGSVVMVGDGINDAAALASASVGVAMGLRGAGISAEAADVVILADEVDRVGDGIALGQRTLRIARQGILFGLGSSLVLMVIATFGGIQPAEGAVLQEFIDAAVIVNALRAR